MKKNLIILMLIPFLIALLGIVTITVSFVVIDNDIIGIEWNYNSNEAFKIRKDPYLLTARGINDKNYPTGPNNELVWEVKNVNLLEESHANVITKDNNYYLEPLSIGDVIVTCKNQKGNVSKSFKAHIYQGGYVFLNSKIKDSGNNIDKDIYYGAYDLDDNKKVNAKISFNIQSSSSEVLDKLIIKEQTDGINIEIINNELEVVITKNQSNLESFTLTCSDDSILDKDYTCYLNVVKDGINVYSYDDLLYCTNKSDKGEIVVLRKSFESRNNYKELSDKNNVTIFGKSLSEINYKDDVYNFMTTSNTMYIDAHNKTVTNNKEKISKNLVSALHVQKDFYGNGYKLNFHDLAYPSKYLEVSTDTGVVKVPSLGDNDLFRGPLPLYTLGNHNSMPLIETLGQDNIGMFIDGNNITVNDIDIRNCDFGNLLSNLHYTGTVVETNGDNITIKNSKLQNGRCVLRAYSSMNMKLENSILSNSRNFLLSIGSNESIRIDDNKLAKFKDLEGKVVEAKVSDFLAKDSLGDQILNSYIKGNYSDNNKMKDSINSIQNALNDKDLIDNQFKGSITIKDTLFYRSGIASISVDSYFNGPFLYSAIPSELKQLLEAIVPNVISDVSQMSYPVKVDITGNTKFYDYKTEKQMDISGIINENISKFLKDFNDQFGTSFDGEISIDTFFPLKRYLFNQADSYSDGKDKYVNVPFIFYGGAYNGSVVTYDTLENKEKIISNNKIDLLDKYIEIKSEGSLQSQIKSAMFKSVTIVIGFEPFKYACLDRNGYLFGEFPKIEELKENAR